MRTFIIWFTFLVLGIQGGVLSDNLEDDAITLIDALEKEGRVINAELAISEWNYQTNLTDYNLQLKIQQKLKQAKFVQASWEKVNKYPWKSFKNETLRRIFKNYAVRGIAALPPEKLSRALTVVDTMKEIYSKGAICDFQNAAKCDLQLDPDITRILATETDEAVLKHAWVEWHNTMGKQCKGLFSEFVELSNEAAKLNNFTNSELWWLDAYEDSNFQEKCDIMQKELEPLYKELHAYVRFKLREVYGEKLVSKRGPIPAHLLGNMWGQTWEHLSKLILPFPDKKLPSITEKMREQGYTPLKMFQVAEDFFVSINMSRMTPTFWNKSMIQKPQNRSAICHASAWDMNAKDDFRIKMCTEVDESDMYTVHHEMGHIEYDMEYSIQTPALQGGANPGFHEAIGDVISLSVSTTSHLQKIGLLTNNIQYDKEAQISSLLRKGLQTIAFLPFGYLMDLWRWNVFNGTFKPEEYNCRFWELKLKYQGLEPPVKRSENYLDPAAKFHIVAGVPYLRYFVSHVLQFQFYQALCEKAGEYSPENPSKPLSECDFYNNTKAGNSFKEMLALGKSKPWPDTLEILTGTREMDARAILRYFKELHEWLNSENKKNGEYVGWDIPEGHTCANKGSSPE